MIRCVWLAVLVASSALAAPRDEAEKPVDVRPTLDQIFRRPRLLGTRPTSFSVSADGAWVVYQRATSDLEDAKNETFLVRSSGGDPIRLFDDRTNVRTIWTRRPDELLVVRDGWLELHVIDAEGRTTSRPLAEVGNTFTSFHSFEDRKRIAFSSASDAQLFVLDLDDGSRRTPAADLKNRSTWFEVFGDESRAAIFADRSTATDKVAAAPAPAATDAPAKKPDDASATKDTPKVDKAKRVLWILDLSGATPPKETKFEEGDRVRVLSSGRFALREVTDRSAPRTLVMADYLTENVTTVPVRSSLPGDPAARVDFELFDLDAGKVIEIALDAGERYWTSSSSLAKSSDRILFDRVSDDFHVRQLLLVDPAARSVSLVFSERDDAWIGGPIEYSALSSDGARVFFTSEIDGYNHFYSAAQNGKNLTQLTASPEIGEVSAVLRLGNEDRFIVTHNQGDSASRKIDLVDCLSGERKSLSPRNGVADGAVASADGSTIVHRQAFLGETYELYCSRIGAAEPTRLTFTQPPELAAFELPVPEIVEYANPTDGAKVKAYLFKPPGFDPQKRYPLVIFAHGAGYLQEVKRSLSSYEVNFLFHHRLARKGYIVLDPDFRHSEGYGRKFRTDIHGFMGGKDLDDIVAGIDWLAASGYVDSNRVGIYGGSYGGFLTLMALFTKPDRFAAGCALRSVTDWRTYNAWYTNPRLGDPKKDARNYERSSPIDHAKGLTKPLLLLHGLKDSNVFAQDTIRLLESLIELKKDHFEVMLYPSQDHGFVDADSWFDQYRRIERFFDRHVGNGVQPH